MWKWVKNNRNNRINHLGHYCSEKVILNSEFFIELVHHIQQFLVGFQFVSIYVYTFDIFGELNWTVNLHLFISSRAGRGDLFGFGSIDGCLELIVVQFVQNLKAILECGDWWVSITWVHICKGASWSHVFFEQEIRLTVAYTGTHTFRIICKVYYTILNSLKICSFCIFLIEHSILPGSSRSSA